MSRPVFDIEVEPIRPVQLVLDLPGQPWDPGIIVPAVTLLSDRLFSRPSLSEMFQLSVIRDGRLIFSSARSGFSPLYDIKAVLNGTAASASGGDIVTPADGLTIVLMPADTYGQSRALTTSWPTLLWLFGPDADIHYIAAHKQWAVQRTVADPNVSPDRLKHICEAFIENVVTAESPVVRQWLANSVGMFLEGMGYVAS